MKKILQLYFLILITYSASFAQNIGINATGAAPAATAMLDISSTTSGLLVPRMTTAQRTAITSPALGLLVYDTTLGGFWYYDGTTWIPLLINTTGWNVTGNNVTNTNNIMGSLNNQPVRLFSNNVERMRIINGSNGEVVLNQPGAFAYYSGDIFSAYANGNNYAVNGYISGTGSGISGFFENTSTGTNSTGVLTIATGTGYGLYADATATNRPGIFGASSAATGTAIIGLGNNLATYYTLTGGSGGAFTSSNSGVYGFGSTATANGGIFVGNNTTASTLTGGTGSASTGTNIGAYGHANNTGNNTWGGYFNNGTATDYAYVGGRTAGTNYKINGPGTVSTIVSDVNNKRVNLYCPEAPEILFQDFGTGELVNGKAHIDLDSTFAKNITVNTKHPLRVIIQLEGDCNGVFVTNKTGNSFDVVELKNGNSNITFTWFVTANRADTYLSDGTIDSKHADVRFGYAPLKLEDKVLENIKEDKPKVIKKR